MVALLIPRRLAAATTFPSQTSMARRTRNASTCANSGICSGSGIPLRIERAEPGYLKDEARRTGKSLEEVEKLNFLIKDVLDLSKIEYRST